MPTVRIPLSWPLDLRSTQITKTPRRINVLAEQVDERHYVLKRPGLLLANTTIDGLGQGLHYYNGQFYAVVDDTLIFIGLTNSGSSGATWTATSDGPWLERITFQTIVLNNVLFVVGGLDDNGDPLNDVWSIQPGQGWKLCTSAAPWAGRAGFMLGSIGDSIYVMGGIKAGNVVCTDVWSSTDGSEWTLVTEKMQPNVADFGARYGAGVISADNGIYLIGGRDGSLTSMNSVIFSTDGEEWNYTTQAGAFAAREFMATWYYQNKLWIGGGESSSTVKNDVYSSSDGGRTWAQTTAAAFTAPGLSFAGFAVYADKMWIANGWNGSAVTNKVYSSSDGITWTAVTASGPWAASQAGALVVFQTATAISEFNYKTMYWLGGMDAGGTASNVIYYAALDTTIGTSTAISPPIADQPFQFNSFVEGTDLLLKNQCGLWVIDGAELIPVTDIGYPVETVPGIVVLGGFAYVCDPSGLIRNCDLDDPYHWPMLNAVGADYDDDRAVAITKYLNYLVVFGQWTTQFFYDAGIAIGSPLQPYPASNMKIGCAAAATVCNVGPTVAWVSNTRERHRQVMAFNGLAPQVISTPAIDKILNGNSSFTTLKAFSLDVGGHMLYVLYGTSGASLVFHFSTKQWFEWSGSTITTPFAMAAAASTQTGSVITYLLAPTDGNLYQISFDYLDDDFVTFPVLLITGKVDAGNNRNKFWGQTEVIGDRNAATPSISYSDDDYQTYSTSRTVDMNTARPVLYRNGQSRRRIFKYEQQDRNAMRLEAIELTFEQGD